MSTVAVGKKVPKFSLPATGGKSWQSMEASGEQLVIYFYPKDMTSGCTVESQQFRDLHDEFRKAHTRVVGVSRDNVASHEQFKEKENLPFPLLADEKQELCKLFDVIKKTVLNGRKFAGLERSTFLIDANGVLRQEWRAVKVTGHAAEVLKAAQALAQETRELAIVDWES
jgi:thioredoxin-dependent peroxiredoxin